MPAGAPQAPGLAAPRASPAAAPAVATRAAAARPERPADAGTGGGNAGSGGSNAGSGGGTAGSGGAGPAVAPRAAAAADPAAAAAAAQARAVAAARRAAPAPAAAAAAAARAAAVAAARAAARGCGGRGGGAGSAGGGGRGGATGSGGLANVTVYVAGDSTVQTYANSSIHQAGWGQFFDSYFVTQVTVDNRAIGGRTSRRFIEEGRLTTILSAARAGDYLFVQFGTNDSNQTATYDDGEPYYLAPATDFKTWMQMYIDGAKGRGVTPVLVTPPPRNSCRSDGVSFNYSFTSYATAMKELGQTNSVAVVDLGARAVTYLNGKADCDWASANFFLVRADGTVDGTHFQETGANILAGLVVEGVGALALPLASFIK